MPDTRLAREAFGAICAVGPVLRALSVLAARLSRVLGLWMCPLPEFLVSCCGLPFCVAVTAAPLRSFFTLHGFGSFCFSSRGTPKPPEKPALGFIVWVEYFSFTADVELGKVSLSKQCSFCDSEPMSKVRTWD